MARVTVEDCILKVPNRFELVLLASQRARDLSSGAEETLDRDNDKNPVVALREIAEETIPVQDLKDELIFGLQKYVDADEPEDENTAILAAAEKEWSDVLTEGSDSGIGDAAAADAAALQSEQAGEDVTAEDPVGDLAPAEEASPAPAEEANPDKYLQAGCELTGGAHRKKTVDSTV